mgnify:CR=1 FL=1|jgi:hypothetical protein
MESLEYSWLSDCEHCPVVHLSFHVIQLGEFDLNVATFVSPSPRLLVLIENTLISFTNKAASMSAALV